MNQQERVSAPNLASVGLGRPIPLDEGVEDLDLVRLRIESGHAFLRVVEYPWGVEFELSEAGGQD